MDKNFSEIQAKKSLFIGKNCLYFDALDSTNNYTASLIKKSNLAEGTAILAHTQLKGKGQGMNKWYAEPGKNLTFSLVLTPKFLRSTEIFYLNILASIAIHRLLKEEEITAQIKWPNDVLVNKKKIAGILVETGWKNNQINHAIVGVGLNVNQTDFHGLNGTSIALEKHTETNLSKVFSEFCYHFEALYLKLRSGEVTSLTDNYLSYLYAYKNPVLGKYQEEECSIEIIGVDNSGKLLAYINGEMKLLAHKEVSFILR